MNIEEVKNHIKYLREDKFPNEFYVALILYDMKGLSENQITEKMVSRAYDIYDKYESIYNPDTRETALYQFNLEEEPEEEMEKGW